MASIPLSACDSNAPYTVGQGHTTPGHTFAELVQAYENDFLPLKAPTTQYQERFLYRWLCTELGDIALANLSPLVLRTWRDSLRPFLKPNSIRRYMTSLSAVLTVAV